MVAKCLNQTTKINNYIYDSKIQICNNQQALFTLVILLYCIDLVELVADAPN